MIVYRASELGSCIRAQVLAHEPNAPAPAPTPGWLARIFQMGEEHETACWDAMLHRGYGLTDSQLEVVLPITETIQIEGHLDGKVFGPAAFNVDRRVLEIKSPAAWAKFEKAYKTNDWSDPLAYRYSWQVSVYMVATGLEAVIACLDGEQVRTFGIELPIRTLNDIQERVESIESLVGGPLPECVRNDGGGCPYRHVEGGLCYVQDVSFDPLLDELVGAYDDIRSRMASLDVMLKERREDILVALGDREKVTTDESKVTRYTTTRKTLDKAALIADGVDVSKYEKVTTSEGLRVTVRGTDEDFE